MTLDELAATVARTPWFSRVGEFHEREGAVTLAAVASSAAWSWLPTSPDVPDPIHGALLPERPEQEGKTAARREAERSVAGAVLASLRAVPDSHQRLVDGPHDFTPAAKGGAQYAARMAPAVNDYKTRIAKSD